MRVSSTTAWALHADDLQLARVPACHQQDRVGGRSRRRRDARLSRRSAGEHRLRCKAVDQHAARGHRNTARASTWTRRAERRTSAPPRIRCGTTVDVSDLFYNTPARRKFLKTERTELAHLNDIVTRLALARLDVEFEMRNGSAVQHLAPSEADGLRRVAQLLGAGFAAAACRSTTERDGLRLHGWVGVADPFARASGSAVLLRQRPFRERQASSRMR